MDKKELKVGDYIRYRPLGCPIPHFAKIIDEYHGLYIIHVVGPYHRITGEKIEYKDVGIAIVVAFEGIVEGKVPEVGKTVKFRNEKTNPEIRVGGVTKEAFFTNEWDIKEGRAFSAREIKDAIKRGACTMDGIKFRTRAQAGRCHGSFCATRIMKILSK